MRVTPLAAACTLLALSACHARVDVGDEDKGDNVHIAMTGGDAKDQVSIKVPGLAANVTLPGLNLGGHIDMDGIALAPATDVKTVDVRGDDKSVGTDANRVQVDFTNPGLPASLVSYYSKAATDAGYTTVATATAVAAAKGKKKFALSVAPDAKGSRGRIVMSGAD